MIIREYKQEDRQDVVRCIGLLQDYIATLDPLHRHRHLADFDAETYISGSFEEVKKHSGAVYVAEEEGNMVGCIIGAVYQDLPDSIQRYPSTNGKIVELIVLPEHRGKGVGNALMERMEQYLVSQKCTVITVECFAPNMDAHRFYEKLGYNDRLITLIKAF